MPEQPLQNIFNFDNPDLDLSFPASRRLSDTSSVRPNPLRARASPEEHALLLETIINGREFIEMCARPLLFCFFPPPPPFPPLASGPG